jgi:hypothetical protein
MPYDAAARSRASRKGSKNRVSWGKLTDEDIALTWETMDLPLQKAAKTLGLSYQGASRRRMVVRRGTFVGGGWTKEETDYMIWAYQSVSMTRIAHHLGKKRHQVKGKLSQLVKAGILSRTGLRNFDPNRVGTRILLAKTCIDCGLLLGGSNFAPQPRDAGWSLRCHSCRAKEKVPRSRRYIPSRAERRRQLQALTVPHAKRYGGVWTSKEMQVLADGSQTNFAKAMKLGRTYYAVNTAVGRYGFSSKPEPLPEQEGEWRVLFESVKQETVGSKGSKTKVGSKKKGPL